MNLFVSVHGTVAKYVPVLVINQFLPHCNFAQNFQLVAFDYLCAFSGTVKGLVLVIS